MLLPRVKWRRAAAACAIAALVGAMATPTMAKPGAAQLPAGNGRQTVFVELTGAPTADEAVADVKAQAAAVAKEQHEFRSAVKASGLKFTERYAYSTLFNGFSMTVATADLPKLARMPGVTNIYPVMVEELPELQSSTDMIRAPEVVESGYDGTGVKVAIIDTGIDYTHPALGGCLGTACRVARGYDFVGDEYVGPDSPVRPDADPMDQNGHGTHVAGIVGAFGREENGIRGVAPGVLLYAYKVFGATGPTSADIMVAAMERAYQDQADVVNMSIGSSFQWPQYPTGKAADRLVKKGVVVSVSAGNSGANGLIAGGAPSVSSRVLAVASFDNTEMTVLRADISDGSQAGYGVMTFSPEPYGMSLEVVPVPNLGNADDDYGGLDVTGKVALISRGTDTFGNKVARAMRFGAAAAIVHNNTAGFFAGTLGTPDNGGTPWIPAMSLSFEDGERLRALAAGGSVTITFTDEATTVANPTGNQISSFSSWGPAPDLSLKPDLGAPGGMIYSTYPLHLGTGGSASLSGTSMAAPHAAGAAALILHARPGLKAQQVMDLMRNTSTPKRYGTLEFLWPVNRQGAGMIDVVAAVNSPVRAEPAKLSLGELGNSQTAREQIDLVNMTRHPVTYTVTHHPALASYADTPNNQTVKLTTHAARVSFNRETVTVPARGRAHVRVNITPPADGFEGLLFGGYITLTPDDGGPALNVPYLGWQGDYQAFSTLDYNLYALPWLASLDGASYTKRESMTINPAAEESAYVLINLARQASQLRLVVLNSRGRTVATAVNEKFVGRNSGPDAFTVLAWDGRDKRGVVVPSGQYTLELQVLRPLGDPHNPSHWDIWESGVITVRY